MCPEGRDAARISRLRSQMPLGDFGNRHSTSFNSDERAMLKPIGCSRGASEWYFDPEK
jgi:hypothetical protein